MSYSPKSIANFFIELAASKGESISPMKLQKLVYYAHGWYAGYTKTPLINETIEAWQYGPVISSLYHEFKQFGSNAIKSKATDFDSASFNIIEVQTPAEEPIRKFLTNVWDSYGKYTAIKLSEMTHAAGSPWEMTWKSSGGVKGVDIPLDMIADHFTVAIEKSKQKVAH
jgi:uncharacterized phage-associated protein